MSVPFELYF